MTKFWDPGRVKTRLGESIGMGQSALLHQAFTTHLCRQLHAAGDAREICFAPDSGQQAFEAWLTQLAIRQGPGRESESDQRGWGLWPQGKGDLGERMSRWFRRHLVAPNADDAIEAKNAINTPTDVLREGNDVPAPNATPDQAVRAVLIGADLPTLGESVIADAFAKLADHDVVLGPAADGGYYLIGLAGPWTQPLETLFRDIPWSESEVFATTCDRITHANLSLAILPIAEDIDTITELEHLISKLGQKASSGDETAASLLGQINHVIE